MARAVDRRTSGFTLIEVLVALVVLSVGMLGIAALYLEGLRAGRTALYRTTAVNLAADMADRIRANRGGGLAYDGTGPGADEGCVNGAVDCTSAEMAADDWFGWNNQLQDLLPAGSEGEIDVVGGPPAAFSITVRWPEPGQEQPASYTLQVVL
jgi:type IV pilus assembly protein PilV